MTWRTRDDLGTLLVAFLHDQLKVDDAYLCDAGRGFTWWPGDFGQTILADVGILHNASTLYRINIETDLVKANGHARELAPAISRHLGVHADLSAVSYSAQHDTFRLHTSVYASYDNEEWLKRALLAAVCLQLAEAPQLARYLCQLKGVAPATSAHPKQGLRTSPDAVLGMAQQFILPSGKGPSRWEGSDEWHFAVDSIRRICTSYECDGHGALKVELPYDYNEGSIRLEISAVEPHPSLGSGLRCTLRAPICADPNSLGLLAHQLNELERKEWNWCHDLGAWGVDDGGVMFRCFLPNLCYVAQILPDMAHDMALRAKWLNESCGNGHVQLPQSIPA